MKKWKRKIGNITAAALLVGISGDEQRHREQPPPPETPYVITLNDNRKTNPVTNPEAIRASDALWKAIVASTNWDYSKLFDSTTLSVNMQIDAAKLHSEATRLFAESDSKFTMKEVASGYKAMTGQDLKEITIDERVPSVAEMQAVATQIETSFKQFGNTNSIGKTAAAFGTLAKGEKRPRFIMAIPRKPDDANCKSGIETLYHWCALKQTIESLGAEVITLDPKRPRATHVDSHEFREIYTRDPIIVLDDKKMALVPDFAAMEKEFRGGSPDPHVPALEKELRKQGYTIVNYKGRTQGGDVIYDRKRKLILVGVDMAGFDVNRSFTAEDAKAMGELTGCTVIRVKRVAYKFYHLDTAIAPLPDGKYLINPVVTDEATYQDLKTKIGVKNIIEIPRDENRYFSNLVAIGHTLVMPSCSTTLEQRLKDNGFKVITPEKVGLPTGAWDIGGGSVHCMTQQVMRTLKHSDKEAYASITSSPEFRDKWREKMDPAYGMNLHQKRDAPDLPYHLRTQAEFDLEESRKPRGKC